MALTYVKTYVTDEATDEDSPGTETVFQDIIQSGNYTMDALFDGGANSELIKVLNYYESGWVSIGANASNNFAHGLSYTPTIVFYWINNADAYTSYTLGGTKHIVNVSSNDSVYIDTVDGTNVTIKNDHASTAAYIKVVAW